MNQNISTNQVIIVGLLVGCLIVYLIGIKVAENRLKVAVAELESATVLAEGNFIELANQIARGEMTEQAQAIIADCTVGERTQFENRLVKLDTGLSRSDLQELDALFSRCAPVTAIQRAVSLIELEYFYESAKTLNNQLQLLQDKTDESTFITNAEKLLVHERAISQLLFDQVSLQKEIIDELQLGLPVESASANELRTQASVMRTELQNEVNNAALVRDTLTE
jgi:hypothetical protein